MMRVVGDLVDVAYHVTIHRTPLCVFLWQYSGFCSQQRYPQQKNKAKWNGVYKTIKSIIIGLKTSIWLSKKNKTKQKQKSQLYMIQIVYASIVFRYFHRSSWEKFGFTSTNAFYSLAVKVHWSASTKTDFSLSAEFICNNYLYILFAASCLWICILCV